VHLLLHQNFDGAVTVNFVQLRIQKYGVPVVYLPFIQNVKANIHVKIPAFYILSRILQIAFVVFVQIEALDEIGLQTLVFPYHFIIEIKLPQRFKNLKLLFCLEKRKQRVVRNLSKRVQMQ
jgi:hypothetical protein